MMVQASQLGQLRKAFLQEVRTVSLGFNFRFLYLLRRQTVGRFKRGTVRRGDAGVHACQC